LSNLFFLLGQARINPSGETGISLKILLKRKKVTFFKVGKKICPKKKIQFDNDFHYKNT
jgi:hypothetical protein